jgi:hypothetical protein
MSKLVYGVGINDADYPVQTGKGSTKITCPFYSKWFCMLRRCYGKKELERNKTYSEVAVCEEWKTFSNFRAWMEKQDHTGLELDKDLLCSGVKLYSPETCCFISHKLNSFLSTSRSGVELLCGVYKAESSRSYQAYCTDSVNFTPKKRLYLGMFPTELEAHLAWKTKKHELACKLAELETDPRIIHALRTRYAGDDIYEA